jgi:hypothetical protein
MSGSMLLHKEQMEEQVNFIIGTWSVTNPKKNPAEKKLNGSLFISPQDMNWLFSDSIIVA